MGDPVDRKEQEQFAHAFAAGWEEMQNPWKRDEENLELLLARFQTKTEHMLKKRFPKSFRRCTVNMRRDNPDPHHPTYGLRIIFLRIHFAMKEMYVSYPMPDYMSPAEIYDMTTHLFDRMHHEMNVYLDKELDNLFA
jgi:hypothetical protein